MTTADNHRYMARALVLARRGLYTADPNPRVGCVLVRDGRIVGEGWHQQAGLAHAEINALADAAGNARGATAYVTLEPCCHQGRTGPCTKALVAAGVERVVVAMRDPNPTVSGNGLKELAEAGIETHSGLLAKEAEALNPGFAMRMKHGRPYIRCKLAMSLDGRTAMASGESNWITGPGARGDVQALRARSSAVLTGVGTVLADDPSMTVREQELSAAVHQPVRVVLDPTLQTPINAKMLLQAGRTVIVTNAGTQTAAEQLSRAGAEVVRLAGSRKALDLATLMAYLAAEELNEVLLECGATLSGAMLRAGLIDELVVYMAPLVMGDGARGLFHLPGLESLADSYRLEIQDLRAVGKDWRLTARTLRPT